MMSAIVMESSGEPISASGNVSSRFGGVSMCEHLPDDRTNGRSMGTIDEGLEAQIRNIEERYGKPLSE
jgi:hypothetical protein